MKCMKDGCRRAATKKIKFHINLVDGSTVNDLGFNLNGCDSHATTDEINHILMKNESTKEKIELAFSLHRMSAPDWERSYAEWLPINEPVPIRGKENA